VTLASLSSETDEQKTDCRKASLFFTRKTTGDNRSPMTVMMTMPMPTPVPAMVMVMVPAPPVVAMAPMMMMPVPAHFGRHLLPGILLHSRRSARIDQRNSLCALDWSRDQKHCTDSHKTQSSRSDHSDFSSHAIHARAVRLPSRQQPAATRELNLAEGDVNDD